jgi:hypothetical protein
MVQTSLVTHTDTLWKKSDFLPQFLSDFILSFVTMKTYPLIDGGSGTENHPKTQSRFPRKDTIFKKLSCFFEINRQSIFVDFL